MDNDSQPPAKSPKKDEVLGNITAKSFDSAPMMMTADELAETLCISLRQVWRLAEARQYWSQFPLASQ